MMPRSPRRSRTSPHRTRDITPASSLRVGARTLCYEDMMRRLHLVLATAALAVVAIGFVRQHRRSTRLADVATSPARRTESEIRDLDISFYERRADEDSASAGD